MTASNIQSALIHRLTEILKDFPLKLSYNDPAPFKIFRHKIPERLESKFDYTKKDTHNDVYPFCVVKIDTGSKAANHEMEVSAYNILIGVKNEGHDGEGYDDVMACIQAIWNDFNQNPLLHRRYKFEYPSDWALNDGETADTHPFYYGVVQLKFKSSTMQNLGGNLNG
ncbi:MAG: hypothetical protein ABS948_11880 [Solibacillus sp.]